MGKYFILIGGIEMTMKLKVGFISLFLVLILAACGGNTPTEGTGEESAESSNDTEQTEGQTVSEETIVLKFATHESPEGFFAKTVTIPFMDRITELTDGQIEFEFYPSQQLGNVSDFLDLTAQGVTDIAYYVSIYTPERMPYSSAVVGIPGLNRTSNQGSRAFHEVSQQSPMLETDFLANGVRPIFGYVTNPYDFWGKDKLVKSPEDLRGLQVRSAGGLMNKAVEFFGGTPVSIPTPDMYEATERGIIDAIGQYGTTLNSFGLGELLGYGTQGVRFTAANVGFIINENVWQSLPDDVQQAIHQAANEIADSGSRADDEENKRVVQEWSELMEIYTLSLEEQAEWDKLYSEFQEIWIEEKKQEGLDQIEEVIEQYREALDKYSE